MHTRVYTLKTMTTEDVDYGIIPRDYIDSANESFLSEVLNDLSEQYRVPTIRTYHFISSHMIAHSITKTQIQSIHKIKTSGVANIVSSKKIWIQCCSSTFRENETTKVRP